MKMPARFFALAWLGPFIAGCAPFPHRVVRVPEIRGTLTDAGVPVTDAIVLIAQNRDEPCGEAAIQGRTNDRGEFLIPEQFRTAFIYDFINPPDTVSQLTALCFEMPGGPAIFRGRLMHSIHESAVVNVACDSRSPNCDLVRCDGECQLVSICSESLQCSR
jgi:hypothetical protein